MAGIDYYKLHESESVHLLLGRRVPVAELRTHFIEAGFAEEDDFFFLPRQDGQYPWQSEDIVTADFFDGDQQVDCEGICDSCSSSSASDCDHTAPVTVTMPEHESCSTADTP